MITQQSMAYQTFVANCETEFARYQRQQMTARAIEFIQPKWFREEPDLYATKWWDYKRLHPVKATELFAEAYKTAHKEALKKRRDLYIGLNHTGLKQPKLFDNAKSVITGLWRARQTADRYGVDYLFYCSKAFAFAETMNFTYLPVPTQIYNEKRWTEDAPSMVEWILKDWRAVNSGALKTPDDAFYYSDNYIGHAYQREYQRHLIGYTEHHPFRAMLLSDLVYERELLLESLAIKVYGEKELAKARYYADCASSPSI